MLVHPRPKPDESISAYLLRVSECNGYERPGGLLNLAGLSFNMSTMHIVLTKPDRLPALAKKIGRPVTELLDLVYTPEQSVKLPSYAQYHGRKIPITTLRLKNSCVCPECLVESDYGRQNWDWALFAACGQHGKLLLDRCPQCGEPVARYRRGVSICNCEFDFRTAETEAVDTRAVDFVRALLAGDTTYGDPDDALKLLTIMAGVASLWDQLEPDLFPFWTTPVARLHEGLTDACDTLRSGSIASFVQKIGERRMARWPELGPRAALLPFLTHHDQLKGILDPEIIDEVGRRLHPAPIGPSGAQDDETISLEGVQTIFGVSDRVAVDMVTYGALKPVRGPKVDGYGHWVFGVADVIGLMQALRKKAPKKHSPIYRMRDLSRGVYAHLTKGFGHVLGMIRDGSVEVVTFDEMAGTLPMTLQGLVDPKAKVQSNQVSVKDCAKHVGIYTDAIYRIIKAGILPFTMDGPRYVVSGADLDEFTRTHVFVKELATKLKVNPRNLAEKLMDAGVSPVSGPRVDKGLVYLFRREDVAAVNLRAISKKPTYITITGRKAINRHWLTSGLYMESAEVAKAIGVTIQGLSRIERAGLLKRRMVKDHLGNTRLFLAKEVNNYIAQFRNNPEMLTLEQAAAMLGETPEYFVRKWVRFGNLKAVSDGLNLWYRRSDVEPLKTEKQAYMTANEAGRFVGGDKSTVGNWTKMGLLKPVSGPTIDGSKWYLYDRAEVEALARTIQVEQSPTTSRTLAPQERRSAQESITAQRISKEY
ncbi:MAG: TniQ family protein [Thiobacillaceae bacterium]